MFNTPFGGYGYAPNQAPAMPAFKNLFGKREMDMIRSKPQGFSTKMTQEDLYRAICLHKDENGIIVVDRVTDENGDVAYHCPICGATFHYIDPSTPLSEIKNIVANFNDLFQTVKLMDVGKNEDMKNIYMFEGYLRRMTQLWKILSEAWSRIANQSDMFSRNNDRNVFDLAASIFGNGAMSSMPGYGYYGAPQQQGFGQPQFQQPHQPMYNPQQPFAQYGQPQVPPQAAAVQTPGVGYPGQPVTNPIGYVDPNAQTAPMPGYPQQQQPNVAPQAPAQPAAQQPQTNQTPFGSVVPPQGNAATVPPMPPAPQNPNVNADKAEVSKAFIK